MPDPMQRTWAEIRLDALAHNFETIRRRVGAGVKLLGVVKADAYGHGAVRVARELERLGAAYLAVATPDEAEELREGGVKLPVLLLGRVSPTQTERLLRGGFTATAESLADARAFSDAAVRAGKRLKLHVKLDTGMGRLGFDCGEASFAESLRDILTLLKLPGLEVEGVFTHFSVSDEPGEENAAYTRLQHERFTRMIEAVRRESGFRFPLCHCCAAGGIAGYPEWAHDMVRCGILLYGTGALAERLGLRPVMTLKSAVCSVKDFPADAFISYGRTFRTARPSRIAVVPIGYADGLHRALSGKAEMLTPYGRAPQIGRICMDMCMLDVTELPQLRAGDEVEIFGEHVLCAELAARCGTIPYELLCAVSPRVPRVYLP